jgi:hypothetical protein
MGEKKDDLMQQLELITRKSVNVQDALGFEPDAEVKV